MKTLAICSGGLDSAIMLAKFQKQIKVVVSFNYGSKHNAREIPMAKFNATKYKKTHIIIPLKFISDYFHSNLLKGQGHIPEGHYAEPSMKATVVPFRNGIMLSIACGIAESLGLDSVMYGNHAGD